MTISQYSVYTQSHVVDGININCWNGCLYCNRFTWRERLQGQTW